MKLSKRLHPVLLMLASAALAACGSSSNSASIVVPPETCSVADQNQTIYEIMQDWYLWYEELPSLDPTSFPSQEALLDALRFQPLDRFSYLTTVAEEDALFGSSQFIGVGFRSQTDTDLNQQLVLDAFEGGPADSVGLVRGSTILAVDGVPIAEILAAGTFSEALGPAEVGYEFELTFQKPDGTVVTDVLAKDVVTIPPVTAARVFEVNGQNTGYLVFRNFVEPGVPALNQAFTEFRNAGVTQLIVDLRYNGGGLVSVLEHFANLLAARTAPAQPFAGYRYNDKNSDRDRTFFLASSAPSAALLLDRVVFITTESSASASEMLVNGIPPYITAAIVGTPSFGKPVGQLGFRFCENVLRPVSFSVVNGLGTGDYFDGLPVDCPAADNAAVPFGQAGEDSFDAAVHWLQFGFCPQTAMQAKPLADRLPDGEAAQPMWRLNDAH
jgi:hypothetical protein